MTSARTLKSLTDPVLKSTDEASKDKDGDLVMRTSVMTSSEPECRLTPKRDSEFPKLLGAIGAEQLLMCDVSAGAGDRGDVTG